ncbi:aminotransferase class I/II-fold pyridoxal phosphate-dependent enzyme [Plesiomonas shigelloides]|uniref:amino acid aminotransferase n=1 Tax=Plesiomonas shigelloides TaxID=703 RepID=UPI0012627898|nr:amino acid aminotransferase [Plesiomonas shigelloides]KAB7691413.1 aminotransferase class I/II-fold pyridoxal phosphate-dependent enzyme [Plesiomonas shigelloides]
MFEHIIAAPADPILGLADTFRADPRAHKINLSVGVYKDDAGQTPVLHSVKKAEKRLLEEESSKNYLSIDGLASFAACTQALLFGADSAIVREKRAKTAQTPGGTGALRVAAEFIARQTSANTIWISNPTWPNHASVFKAAGLEVREYGYFDAANMALDFDAMLTSLEQAKAGDVVLFHGCCHNPTGIDPTPAQWDQLAKLSAAKGWLPLFDFAYQGFARGLEEDAYGLRAFCANHSELLVASSFSKNFGLYNERVGACTLVAADQETAERAFSQVKSVIRANYSNPPAHGAAVVALILSDPQLKAEWEAELTEMRGRIHQMRELFVAKLQALGANRDFSFIARQNGMFSFSGLNPQQVARLKDEFAIYAVGSGRINVAGITSSNIDPLCQAIAQVL